MLGLVTVTILLQRGANQTREISDQELDNTLLYSVCQITTNYSRNLDNDNDDDDGKSIGNHDENDNCKVNDDTTVRRRLELAELLI